MTWTGWHGHSAVSDRMEREADLDRCDDTLTVGGAVAFVWAVCSLLLLLFVPAMVTCGAMRP